MSVAPSKRLGWGHVLLKCESSSRRFPPASSAQKYLSHQIHIFSITSITMLIPLAAHPPRQTPHMKWGWMRNYYVVINITHSTAYSFEPEIDTKHKTVMNMFIQMGDFATHTLVRSRQLTVTKAYLPFSKSSTHISPIAACLVKWDVIFPHSSLRFTVSSFRAKINFLWKFLRGCVCVCVCVRVFGSWMCSNPLRWEV